MARAEMTRVASKQFFIKKASWYNMNNKEALDFFLCLSQNSNDPQSVKFSINDFSQMDANFILRYSNHLTRILDLGSGTGLILNKLYDKVGAITAVEPFESFSKFLVKSANISVINKTFAEIQAEKMAYDLVTIFGTMHYFNESEALGLYQKFLPALKEGGKIIVKNQFGIREDVTVEGYSEELKCNYFAQYRHLDKEIGLLERVGYYNVKAFDIYPPECNRWDNTHFFAIVAEKK